MAAEEIGFHAHAEASKVFVYRPVTDKINKTSYQNKDCSIHIDQNSNSIMKFFGARRKKSDPKQVSKKENTKLCSDKKVKLEFNDHAFTDTLGTTVKEEAGDTSFIGTKKRKEVEQVQNGTSQRRKIPHKKVSKKVKPSLSPSNGKGQMSMKMFLSKKTNN